MEQAVRALVLVPTKELAQQAQTMIQQLASYCARDIRVANISATDTSASQRCGKTSSIMGHKRSRGYHLSPGWGQETSSL